jgi:hypothetical protein
MLELLIVVARALTLALRGHRELVFENLALRQQLTAMKRSANRPRLEHGDRLFWIALARVCQNWRTALVVVRRTPLSGGIATGSGADGPDGRNGDRAAVDLWINRSAFSSGTWRRRTRSGAHPESMASSALSVSTSRNARCRVC